MIAVSPAPLERPRQAAPAFEELLPAVTRQARAAFSHLPVSEREELVAETVANCYVASARLIERGLSDVIYSTPLAQYAVRQIRCGRRVGAKFNKHDVGSKHCQRRTRVRVERLDRGRSDGAWRLVLVEDRSAGPAEIAASRIDFRQWLQSRTARRRRIAEALASGEAASDVARQFDVSQARVSQLRRELRESWQEFQGERAGA